MKISSFLLMLGSAALGGVVVMNATKAKREGKLKFELPNGLQRAREHILNLQPLSQPFQQPISQRIQQAVKQAGGDSAPWRRMGIGAREYFKTRGVEVGQSWAEMAARTGRKISGDFAGWTKQELREFKAENPNAPIKEEWLK